MPNDSSSSIDSKVSNYAQVIEKTGAGLRFRRKIAYLPFLKLSESLEVSLAEFRALEEPLATDEKA